MYLVTELDSVWAHSDLNQVINVPLETNAKENDPIFHMYDIVLF